MHRLPALDTPRARQLLRVFWILLTLGVAAVGVAAPSVITFP